MTVSPRVPGGGVGSAGGEEARGRRCRSRPGTERAPRSAPRPAAGRPPQPRAGVLIPRGEAGAGAARAVAVPGGEKES